MLSLPRVSEFTYKGVRRVAIEKGPDRRACGLLCLQLKPIVGLRTYKPSEMIQCQKLGIIKTLYYLARSARFTIG